MKYVERFFRWVIWAVVAAVVAWIFKKAFRHATDQSGTVSGRVEPRAPMTAARELFRDPVCGTYVAEDVGYLLTQGGENLHFCSRDCMEHFRASNRLAAGV